MSEYNASASREFNWDDEINQDSTFVLLPEGDYPFTVSTVTRARHPGSAKLPPCNKAELVLLVEGPGGEATIKHNLFLHSKCEGLLCAFFTAIGLRRHGQPLRMRWDIQGRTGMCHVGVREYTGKDGEVRKANEILRFLDPEDAPKQTQLGAGTSQWKPGSF